MTKSNVLKNKTKPSGGGYSTAKDYYMYYLEIKLRSGNWATIKGAKSLDELKKIHTK